MKKTLILLFAFMAFGVHAQDITKAVNLGRYAQANAAYPKQVVFIGNSITDGWLKASPDFFTSNNFIGRGISGQTSPQLLLRFRQDVINLSPVAVVINIGINDIAQNTGEYVPEFTMSCIQSMAELAEYNGIKVILSTVLPGGEFPWRKEIKDVSQKVDALNAMIKAYAEPKGYPYIDYNTPMRDEKGAMKAGLSTDGIHPTKEGYQIMEKLAKEMVDKVIRF
ncbi:GDSL-type esterase/lipase family protein [Bacteroides sp. 51]|uniref:GDSL-type esterase/lipase family protein n=1 Tax=Bacteroides sp. 51 TaxID=2302938 RepID=UPI0013D0E486|nr:GDSL-type esterase/lipase family protein [Bacteroides sp. 51]NDV81211.1 capsular biosynthesis protein [Bacteroides sp. 51]